MILNLLADAEPKADFSSYIMIIVLIVAIIGLFIWSSYSNKKKQKQAQEMVNGIKIGDRVKTIGGVCGFVAEINNAENTFVLRTGMEGKESYVKFDKGAIYQTAPADVKTQPEVVEEVKAEPKTEPKAKKTTKKTSAKKQAEQPTEAVEQAEVKVEEQPAEEK